MGRRKEPLTVAFVQHQDARDVRSWSGILFFAKEAIERHVGRVVDLSPGPLNLVPLRVLRGVIRVTTGKSYSYDHDLLLARIYGKYFTRRVAQEHPDLIFAPAASACLAFLETDVPIIYYSDATWRVMQDYYPGLSQVVKRSARGGDELERRTLERASLALFSSAWASDSAVHHYGADPGKVHTVYIGANLPDPPARHEVLPRSIGKKIRLLLVGVSWERKGGQMAYETLLRLQQNGYDAELTVVGCSAPAGVRHPSLTVIPFLNKAVPEDRRRFAQVWQHSDFFLMPTRAEAAGAVFCEAGAFALPSITTRTGGVPSIVVDGLNGFTLSPGADAEEYASLIGNLVGDPERYAKLCETSRDLFEDRLNWNSWGARVASLVETHLPDLRGRTLANV